MFTGPVQFKYFNLEISQIAIHLVVYFTSMFPLHKCMMFAL